MKEVQQATLEEEKAKHLNKKSKAKKEKHEKRHKRRREDTKDTPEDKEENTESLETSTKRKRLALYGGNWNFCFNLIKKLITLRQLLLCGSPNIRP